MISRFQHFLRQCRMAIGPYRPIRKPAFLPDQRLELRDGRIELRELAQRNLVDWPRDANGSPVDFDDLPNG